ncbi:unnamed protein product [Citrullus colocynthis]|uniref:Uncharacterized protein n=1 Tax=Citrullus colocynthis TaxID=252529 RepID=A0ABP0Y0N8_9ROSI
MLKLANESCKCLPQNLFQLLRLFAPNVDGASTSGVDAGGLGTKSSHEDSVLVLKLLVLFGIVYLACFFRHTKGGTEAIEGIMMDLDEEGESHLNAKFLNWHGYPLKCLPSNFNPTNLLELELPSSTIHHLWTGSKRLEILKVINLSDSKFLSKTPNFSRVPNLERLVLRGCAGLHQLHQSLENLKHPIQLDLKDCKKLTTIPFNICLESLNILFSHSQGLKLTNWFSFGSSLRVLNLSDCNLWDGDLPNDLHSLASVEILDLSQNHFTILPESISHLVNLRDLVLEECFNLLCLPKLPLSVRDVEARDCVSLKEYYNQEKQIPSSEMGITCIPCPTSTEPTQSYKINQLGLSPIHLRTMAQQYLEVLTWQQKFYYFLIPYPSFILSCFDKKRYGFSITPHCPPDYISEENPRIGIALGAAFKVQEHEISKNNNSKPSCEFIIKLETDECPLKSALVFDGNEVESESTMGLSVFYIPMNLITGWLNQCCCIAVSITTDNPFVKVKWSGASVLYQQNAGTFIGNIVKAFFGSPGRYHKSIVHHILNSLKRVQSSTLLDGGAVTRLHG